MSRVRSNSSPELPRQDHESVLECMATNVKLHPRLIHGHRTTKDQGLPIMKPDAAAADMSTPEQVASPRRRDAELRRCNTDLRRVPSASNVKDKSKLITPPPQLPNDLPAAIEEIEKLRRELSAVLTARKSLERMFSSLGREKQMIAGELTRKVHEISELEELVNDLRSQNETLSEKVRACAAEHKLKKESSSGDGGGEALQERNKLLSEQLLKSLDHYRSVKRKYKDSQQEIARFQETAMEMDGEAAIAVKNLHELRQKIADGAVDAADQEIELIETTLVRFQTKLCFKVTAANPSKNSNVV